MTKTLEVPSQQTVAVYHSNRDIRLEKRPLPAIGDQEILIEITASGICGSDVMEWYRLPKGPQVLGHEIAAKIVKTGKKVKGWKAGERVVVSHHVPCMKCRWCKAGRHTVCDMLRSTHLDPGGFAQYARVPQANVERGVFRVPKSLTDDQASLTEPLGCTIRSHRLAKIAPKSSIVIVGAGSAGLLHVALAKASKASCIIVADINQERLNIAKKLGAAHTFLSDSTLPEKVKSANKGNLADVVILCAGAMSAIDVAAQCIDRGGTFLMFAPPPGNQKVPLPLFDFWKDNVTVISSYAAAPEDMTAALKMLASGKLQLGPLISHRLGLEEAGEGFKLVSEAKNCLKVILLPGKGK